MSIKQLQEALDPPINPVESGNEKDWSCITTRFNTPLPIDYMTFIDTYGSGEIGYWLTVLNPFSDNPNISLIDQFFYLLSGLREIKTEHPQTCPYKLLFEPGGLLPWGISIDGDIYCWLTVGMSGKWKIIVIGRHSEPEEYDLSFSEFLTKAINGDLDSYTIPREWNEEKVKFNPIRL